MIADGAFLTPRAIFSSELWETKPAWWSKVWLYILGNANFKDHNHKLRRGDFFTTYDAIHYGCNLTSEGVKKDSIDNVISFLKLTGLITTRKTTRGLIITVVNYNLLQNFSSYSNATENDTENDFSTENTRHYKGTNENNDTNVISENFNNSSKRENLELGETPTYYSKKTVNKKGVVDARHII